MGAKFRDLIQRYSKARNSYRSVLNVLANYANDDGLAWPGRATIARETGLSERTVIRCIGRLLADGHIKAGENAKGGRGLVPVYQILVPERVTSTTEKGDSLTEKGDKCDNERVTSATSSLYVEPNIEPKEEPERDPRASDPPAPPAELHSRNGVGSRKLPFSSPYVNNQKFDPGTGYIRPGTGATPVEVYYERFEVCNDKERLTPPMEDDLVRNCSNLQRLREAITAYSRRKSYNPGNIDLILDWYKDPSRYKRDAPHTQAGTSKLSNIDRNLAAVANVFDRLRSEQGLTHG